MGGAGQDTIQDAPKRAKKQTKKSDGVIQDTGERPSPSDFARIIEGNQKLRFHLSDDGSGNIHFHDDAVKLRAAVPAAIFWSAWDQLKNLKRDEWSYVDLEQGTFLRIQAGFDNKSQINVNVALTKVILGSTFKALEEFVSDQR